MAEEIDSPEDGGELFAAFAANARIAIGALTDVAIAAKRAMASGDSVLIFSHATGEVTDLDLRGSEADILARYTPSPVKRGRPRLGVTAREVTLLPRHWAWLAAQPGGASVALRRLVEAARKQDQQADAVRTRREAAYRFMSAMGGDLPGFEDAARALFAGDEAQLEVRLRPWPGDIRSQVRLYLDVTGSESDTQLDGRDPAQ